MNVRRCLCMLLLGVSVCSGSNSELLRPVMGFDTYYSAWNGTWDLSKFGRTNIYCKPSEAFILVMATNYLQNGLKTLGYDWMCISDGWQGGRDANGRIYADTNRFPSGMERTIEVLHSLGFKVRLYTEVGPGPTCCGKVKSGGTNGLSDAFTFARWKLDGITVDTCNDFNSDEVKRAEHEAFMGYLRSTGANILYDLHVSPTHGQYTTGMAEWMSQVESWQFTTEWGTIADPWPDAVNHIDMAATTTAWMRPGHTPNLLIMYGDYTAYSGNYGRLLFTFWSMFQSPLVVAEDFITYPAWDGAKYQTNGYCIAIDQDPLFAPPAKAFTNGANSEAWIKPLASGATAIALLNRTNKSESITINLESLGVPAGATYRLTDAWNYTNFQATVSNHTFNSPPNSAQLWILSPQRPPALAIESTATNIVLSWPASAPGCFLQRTSDVRSGDWTDENRIPTQSRDRLWLSIPPSEQSRFYRLVQ